MTTEHLPRYMTQQDIKRFFRAIKDRRDRALFGAIYLYGLRAGEATLLKVEDVDFDGNKICIPCLKNGYAGVEPLRQDARKLLKSYVRIRAPHGNALFTTRAGTITKRRIEQLFKQYLTKAGLDSRYVVHSLRHSIAVHILDAGKDIAYVQDHLSPEAADKLDRVWLARRMKDRKAQKSQIIEELVMRALKEERLP